MKYAVTYYLAYLRRFSFVLFCESYNKAGVGFGRQQLLTEYPIIGRK